MFFAAIGKIDRITYQKNRGVFAVTGKTSRMTYHKSIDVFAESGTCAWKNKEHDVLKVACLCTTEQVDNKTSGL